MRRHNRVGAGLPGEGGDGASWEASCSNPALGTRDALGSVQKTEAAGVAVTRKPREDEERCSLLFPPEDRLPKIPHPSWS